MSFYEGHTNQNAPLSGKYRTDYLHRSSNVLSTISESHGSPKTSSTALEEKASKRKAGQLNKLWVIPCQINTKKPGVGQNLFLT